MTAKMRDTDDAAAEESACIGGFRRIYLKLRLNYYALVIVLLIYGCVGALMFEFIEGRNEEKRMAEAWNYAHKRHHSFGWTLHGIVRDCLNNSEMLPEDCHQQVADALVDYDMTHGLLPKSELPLYHWDFWDSLFYASSIFTTIGYGTMACSTVMGRLATIVYAFFGIPLTLMTLNQLGHTFLYLSNCAWRNARSLFRIKVSPEVGSADRTCEPVCPECHSPDCDNRCQCPLWMSFAMALSYVAICAAIFMPLEPDWDYITSFYFFFISLSTIGFGDVIPTHPHLTSACFIFFLIGLSLVSMCLSAVESRMNARYTAALAKLNLTDVSSAIDHATTAVAERSTTLGVLSIPFDGGPKKRSIATMTHDIGEGVGESV